MIREVASLDEMRSLAVEIAGRLPKRALVLLGGPMAAGKTQFTRFMVEALGSARGDSSDGSSDGSSADSNNAAVSPSFALHHSYATARGAVEHFDLFRLKSADDLESIGFWDFFRAPEGVIVIEWYERLEEFGVFENLPRSWPRTLVRIEVPSGASPERRRVVLS